MRNLRAKIALVALPVIGSILLFPGIASAHEEFDLGKVHMEVGFGTEPAYVGQPNSVEVILKDANDKPIVDVTDQLSVTVTFGDQSTDAFALEPNFEVGGDGDYRAWFVPTQAGPYTFHVVGTVHGTKIDVTATSGPKTFAEVQAMSSITFPKVDFPANNELAARIQQDATRTQASIDDATASASDASSAASTARTIGIIGVLVGVVGLIIAIVALAAARKARAA
jgi:Filamin/ABP280 repeat